MSSAADDACLQEVVGHVLRMRYWERRGQTGRARGCYAHMTRALYYFSDTHTAAVEWLRAHFPTRRLLSDEYAADHDAACSLAEAEVIVGVHLTCRGELLEAPHGAGGGYMTSGGEGASGDARPDGPDPPIRRSGSCPSCLGLSLGPR